MIPWTEIEMLQSEHERRVRRVEQSYWMQVKPMPTTSVDHWRWRAMNKLGGWLVALGNRLQAHVEQARQMVYTSHIAMEAQSDPTRQRP
jgi:hypothetical protein